MRIGNVGNARPNYYDRNATVKNFGNVVSQVAPVSQAPAFTYTVPANRAAMVVFAYISAYRVTLPTTLGQAGVNINYTPAGILNQVLLAILPTTWAQNQLYQAALNTTMPMVSTDQLSIVIVDQSTGGVMNFFYNIQVIEYDA